MKNKWFQLLAIFCALTFIVTAVPITTSAAELSVVLNEVDISTSKPESSYDNMESPIQGENIELREECIKYFRCEDGSLLAAIYENPVHYEENGQWKDIDNTLIADETRGDVPYLTNTANSFRVHFPRELRASAPVVVEKDGHSLAWTLQDGLVTAAAVKTQQVKTTTLATVQSANSSGTITKETMSSNESKMTLSKQMGSLSYAQALSNTELHYDVIGSTVKESLVLDKIPSQTSYSFLVTANGLRVQLQEDQSVFFYAAEKDEPVFVIATPYMFDEGGGYSKDIAVSIQQIGNQYRYTITPSRDWLMDSARQYPVTIDPTIETNLNRNAIEATQAYSRLPNNNYGEADILYAGSIIHTDGNAYEYRSFVKLPLPNLNTTIRQRIISAKLYMSNYTYWNLHANDTQVNLHQITSSWSQDTLTWNNKPSYDSSAIYDYTIGQSGSGMCTFDITSLADGWINGTLANNGVMLKGNAVNSSRSDNVCWYSEDVSSSYTESRPRAVFAFRDCNGLEDYWTYTSMSVGRGATAAVNHATGSVTAILPGCGVDGNRLPVTISLIYNTSNSSVATYGGKWRLNYQMRIENVTLENNNDCQYKFIDGDGTTHYLITGSDGSIKDEDRLGLTLTVNTSSTTERFTLTDQNKVRMLFNNSGDLVSIKDTNGNSINITYTNGLITKITDGAGRVYTLNYSSGKLANMVDPAGRTTSYLYNDWDELYRITYPDGEYTNLSYHDTQLKRITGAGQRILLEYDTASPVRVSNMYLYTEDETSCVDRYQFTYHLNSTTVTDVSQNVAEKDIPITYQFNEFLQTVCVVSHNDGRAQSFKYGKSGGVVAGEENRLLMASNTQQSVVNRMLNNRVDSNFTTDGGSYYRAIAPGLTGDVTWDSTHGHTAKGSIKVTRTAITTSTNPYIYGQQTYTVPSTGYYAISAFVNTKGLPVSPGPGAIVRLERWREGEYVDSVQATTVQTREDEWRRLGTALYCQAGDTLKILLGTNGFESMGTMWFDDVQLEMLSESINAHNLLDNTDFWNAKTGWATSGGTWTVTTDSASDKPAAASKVIKVTGGAFGRYRVSQQVTVTDGKKGDAYSFGAWAKGSSALINPDANGDGNRAFSVCVEFTNTDGTTTRRRLSFNRAYSDWQFVSGEAVAAKDYSSVTYYLEYCYNVNTAYFALPYLYKDNYGQSYTYDKNGNVVSAANETQDLSTYAYSSNQLNKLASPTGSTQLLSSNEDTNNLISVMTTNGQRYEYTYDSYGNVTQSMMGTDTFATTLTAGKTYILRNAATGNAFDSTGLAADCIYRNWRWIATSTHQPITLVATGTTDVYAMHPYSDSTLRVDVEGGVTDTGARIQLWTDNGYDPQRFKITRNSNGTYTIFTKITGYTKCIDGQPGDVVDASNGVIVSQQPYVEGDAGQQWYFIEYSPSITDDLHYQTTTTYTADGNYVDKVTDTLGHTTDYYISPTNGNVQTVTTPNSVTYEYSYDSSNLHNTMVSVYGSSVPATIVYSYDGDRLTGISARNGLQYTLTYDELGRSDAVYVGTAATGRRLAKYEYSPGQGLLSKLTYGNGNYANYSYDALGRQTKVWYNTASSNGIETVYNDRGQVGILKDYPTNTRTRYWYDLAGRVIHLRRDRRASGDADLRFGEIDLHYENGTGRLLQKHVKTQIHSTTTDFVYGNMSTGQMPDAVYEVKQNGVTEVQYSYDKLGRLHRRDLPEIGRYSALDFKSNQSTTSSVVSWITGNDGTIGYTYDSVGNITKETRYGYNTGTNTYTYDALNQLTSATLSGVEYTYTYGINGNITSAVKNGVTSTYTYGDSSWPDLLTNYNGQTILYDAIGNPIQYRDLMFFTWQNGRQLASMYKNGVTTSYVYNADGGRHTKTVGSVTTQYYYLDGVLYAETDGTNTLIYLYDEKGVPYAVKINGAQYYYEYNLQGDVIGLFDSTGTRVVAYTYDPWGKLLTTTGTAATTIGAINPLRYRGYYYDAETGFYYCGSRYYDPEIGRWINADGYISTGTGVLGYNMFAYCNNNPVMYADPTGYRIFECCPYGNCQYCKSNDTSNSISANGSYTKDDINIYPPGGKKVPDKINVFIDPEHINNANQHDPNIKVYDSHTITELDDIVAIVDIIMKDPLYDDTVFTRTRDSYVDEWIGHNVLYSVANDINNEFIAGKAQHVDLNEKEKLLLIWDVIATFTLDYSD